MASSELNKFDLLICCQSTFDHMEVENLPSLGSLSLNIHKQVIHL